MSAMLPVPADTPPHLTEVLESCLASLSGEANPLGFPASRSAVVLLVDGLGAANLRGRAGHARFLASRFGKRDVARTVFPSTTAAALASLTTAARPGEHGLVGYRTLDGANDRLVNQLNGWDDRMRPETWQRRGTVFEAAGERGVDAVAIGAPRYVDSGFTRAVLRGARYVAGASISDRFSAALDVLSSGEPALVYLYVPELDQAAHAHGWESDRWLGLLEQLDAEAASFEKRMPRGTGLVVTADHGVVDVPAHRHVFVDARPALVDGVRHVGGEPRCLQLYFEPGLDEPERASVVAAWREAESRRAWVMTRAEAIGARLFGHVDPVVAPRIGDLLVAARAGIAYYDARLADRQAEKMIGQHGSLTDEEMRVPFIRLGAFARG
ncbi:alkaline phosphatase family protein [Agromyces sp. H3Y2-19a]|uniref:alkaline phosphatase family protein n=1 Tax=Agromyces chromiiresistens TaxID=3030835 RepID=UPI0023B973FF|nr:alkaline phosphatase family protein [Agromyces chromiiresistens]MDF0513267.1 alkaline phosphatase family protein [Agromyces chromiiresistens]